MDATTALSGGPAASGGPAPFLLKTYEMVDDCSTDDIVSWSPSRSSFVVWNPPEFASRLLPTYFKHNNFSSFIRQLNTYGFRKIHPERWEFANDDFVQGQKHLLKNIHRRKPIHSHSQQPDQERAALEEEIERLGREKAALQADLWRFKQQQPMMRAQLDGLDRRLHDMELRQEKMVAFVQRAIQNPPFMETLVKMAVAGSVDFSAIHKKRRLPELQADNQSCSSKNEIGHMFHHDFSDKLKLELCSAMSDCSEEQESPQGKQQGRIECLPLVPETLELSDTGTSFCARSLLFPSTGEEGKGLGLCHLNLTLASSSMQVDANPFPSKTLSSEEQTVLDAGETRSSRLENTERVGKEAGKNQGDVGDSANARRDDQSNNQVTVATTGRVNDLFWEQFLTERPGSSDVEEASSSLRAHPGDEPHEERSSGNENTTRSGKEMENLTV